MSNLERHPLESTLAPEEDVPPVIEVLPWREVPLGGPRAMSVRRTLPQRGRTTIGAWCFADHYGPDDVAATGGMLVPPHPHTGLQTVSWLFEGEIEHRDSTGVRALVRPGAVNLMTAGHGISHSEVSTPEATVLHGVQLWVALPDGARDATPFFEHAETEPVEVDDATVRVFAGALADARGTGPEASVTVFSPLVGAQIELPAGGEAWIELDPAFEHGVLVDRGPVRVTIAATEDETDAAADDADPLALTGHSADLEWAELGYLPVGHEGVRIRAVGGPAAGPARVLLIGGVPFGEELVMWWNFIGRSHDEIVGFRREWQADVIAGDDPDGRFGTVDGFDGPPLPAPELPTVRLRPRR